MQPTALNPGNEVLISVIGYADETGAPINNATITATLTDSKGNVVDGFEDIAVPYVSASNGNYQAVVPAFSATPGTGYTLQFVAMVGDVLFDTINRPIVIEPRIG